MNGICAEGKSLNSLEDYLDAIFFLLVKAVGWQWLNKYSVLREIKRLELQVAMLAKER